MYALFCRFKSKPFAAAGALSELRDEPTAVLRPTVHRPDHQHVPVEHRRVRPVVGDRHGHRERHEGRPTAAVRLRPEHRPGGPAVRGGREPDARRRQHVVPGVGG